MVVVDGTIVDGIVWGILEVLELLVDQRVNVKGVVVFRGLPEVEGCLVERVEYGVVSIEVASPTCVFVVP